MQIAHLADIHLGAKPYQYDYRKKDILETFDELIDKLLREKPDLIVVAGDFFDSPHPDNETMIHALRGIRKLADAGLKTVFTYGEHDYPKTRDKTPIELIAEAIGNNVYAPPKIQVRQNSIVIDPYVYRNGSLTVYLTPFFKASEKIREQLIKQAMTAFEADRKFRGGKSILVAHLSFRTDFPFGSILDNPGILPKVNYAAMGHIHIPIVCIEECLSENVTPYAYPGSMEALRKDEIFDGPRGFYMVDISGDIPTLEKVFLDSIRPQYILRTTPRTIMNDVSKIISGNLRHPKYPLIHVELEVPREKRVSREGLHKIIEQVQREYKVFLRIEYVASKGSHKNESTRVSGVLDVKEIISDLLDPKGVIRKDLLYRAADAVLELKDALLSKDEKEVETSIKKVKGFSAILLPETEGEGLEKFMW